LLYREWFVHFRFPGHEQAAMVDSELGPIPEGWKVMKVTEAIHVNPRMKVPKEGLKPYVPMKSLSETSMLIEDVESRSGNSGSKFKNDDTLFARITPCLENGKTGFVQFLPSDTIGLGSTEFIVLRSKTLSPEYVYLMARSDEFRDHAIKSMTGATGRQRVQVDCFEEFSIAHPEQETLRQFVDQVSPLFCGIQVLAEKNETLRRTRDLLLPRLISGEVDVSNHEWHEWANFTNGTPS
jgi:type I restriction enzyme S subunit